MKPLRRSSRTLMDLQFVAVFNVSVTICENLTERMDGAGRKELRGARSVSSSEEFLQIQCLWIFGISSVINYCWSQ